MQILTLRVGERVRIGTGIIVTIVEVSDHHVVLDVVAPQSQQIVKLPALVQHGRDSGCDESAFDSSRPASN